MSFAFGLSVTLLLVLLAISAYVDRIYFEIGKFLSREYTENIEAWERAVEPRLHLGRESVALSASVLRQLSIASISVIFGLRLAADLVSGIGPAWSKIAVTVFELVLVLLVADRLVPQFLFTRTRGLWIARIRYGIEAMFYLILPITLLLGLILSIAALAEPEDAEEPEHPHEAMDALLEAGEEEGVLDEEDRELVRSVVEFGDKVVREVMTPRPEMFAVDGKTSLEQFTAEVNAHNFSRVPVYGASLDEITGIAFARDLLGVKDTEAARRTVAELQKPALFIPETKKVNELLREMQRQKQHMSIVIDEYGGVAGLVTIEDLIEAIVGEIEDEHDEEADEAPVAEPEGTWLVPGSFEVSRLRELFAGGDEECVEGDEPVENDAPEDDAAQQLAKLLAAYEASSVGGLVSEIAGHIPMPGEVVEDGPLRLEVIASTDRRVERVRVALARSEAGEDDE
jgi:CBS domain containing-hemolysin-like protein